MVLNFCWSHLYLPSAEIKACVTVPICVVLGIYPYLKLQCAPWKKIAHGALITLTISIFTIALTVVTIVDS